MNEDQNTEIFGDLSQHDRTCEDLYNLVAGLLQFPSTQENERNYILAAIRRTLSLNKAFRQAIESQNGQMAATLIRLNLDTLARTYALYWAEDTDGMSAETFSKAISDGQSIRNMKLRGANTKATDRWLIDQITNLEDWIPEVYKRTSGAIHFSNFHINQLLQQTSIIEQFDDGSLRVEFVIGPGEKDADPELYRELMQAFLHITMMFVCAVQHRVEVAIGSLSPKQHPTK
jgi:hypothetical protein